MATNPCFGGKQHLVTVLPVRIQFASNNHDFFVCIGGLESWESCRVIIPLDLELLLLLWSSSSLLLFSGATNPKHQLTIPLNDEPN